MTIERLVTNCSKLIWFGKRQSRPNYGTLPESPGWTEKTTENVSNRNLRRAPSEWTIRMLPLHRRGRSQFALPPSVFLFSLLLTLLETTVVFLISKFRRVLNVVFFLHMSFKRPMKMEQTVFRNLGTENSDAGESAKRWRNCLWRDVERNLKEPGQFFWPKPQDSYLLLNKLLFVYNKSLHVSASIPKPPSD